MTTVELMHDVKVLQDQVRVLQRYALGNTNEHREMDRAAHDQYLENGKLIEDLCQSLADQIAEHETLRQDHNGLTISCGRLADRIVFHSGRMDTLIGEVVALMGRATVLQDRIDALEALHGRPQDPTPPRCLTCDSYDENTCSGEVLALNAVVCPDYEPKGEPHR